MTVFESLVEGARAQGHDRVKSASWSSGHMFVVCDGAGGVTGAALAADLVSEELVRGVPPLNSGAGAFFVDRIEQVDKAPRLAVCGGLATALIAVVAGRMIYGASVGDSEAWLITDNDVIVLTADQHKKPLVGSRRCRAVGFGPVPLEGTLILGSDGLFKYCPRQALLAIARSPEIDGIAERLLAATRLSSGALQDDFAVVACRTSPFRSAGSR